MQVLESGLDILAVLKASTASQHNEIERIMPFFDEHLTREIYVSTLSAFLGFYEPIERRLSSVSGWQQIGIDFSQRQRAQLLRNDLRALGMKGAIIDSLPRCDDLPKIDDRFDGLGCMYVLEGSTLGGQLISRELERRLGVGPQSGAAFFHSYGANVGSMWREFCFTVRKYVDIPHQQEATVTAARNTFTSFSRWMEGISSHVK